MADAVAQKQELTVEQRILAKTEIEDLYRENYRPSWDTKTYCPFLNSCAYVNESRGSICMTDWYSHVLCEIFRSCFDDGK